MARSHLYKPIQDAQGNLRTNARVRVFDVGTVNPTTTTLFAADTGSTQIANVHVVANGIVNFYTDEPMRFRIGIKVGDEPEVLFEDVDTDEPGYTLDDPPPSPTSHEHPEYYSADNPPPAPPGLGVQANQVTLREPTASGALTDDDYVVFFDGVDLTATLPTPVGRSGRIFIVKNLNTTNLTVATDAGLIDGDTTRVLAQYDSLSLISNGTNWSVV